MKTQGQALSIAAHIMQGGTTVFMCRTAAQGEDMWIRTEAILTPFAYGNANQLKKRKKNFAFEVIHGGGE
jgi:hypothetical protein